MQKYTIRFSTNTQLMVWSTDADDAKTLLDVPFPMNYVMIYQLTWNLIDICLDNMLQILCKSLLCFAKIGNIGYTQKSAKFGL